MVSYPARAREIWLRAVLATPLHGDDIIFFEAGFLPSES
jgi:hypothetical protein